jgi:hypothetical protein
MDACPPFVQAETLRRDPVHLDNEATLVRSLSCDERHLPPLKREG